MSDITTDPGTDGVADSPAQSVPPEVDPFDDAKVESFDRKYVEKLRGEAARHRTEKKTYDDAFSKWSPEDRTFLLDTVRTAADDPKKGAEVLRQVADLLNPAEKAALKEEIASGEVKPEDVPLTRGEMEKFLAEKETARQQDAAVEAVTAEVEKLGFPRGSEGHYRVLWLAKHSTNFDVAAAAAKIKGEKDSIISDYLKEKKTDAESHTGPGPSGGAPASEAKPIVTFNDASESARARIRAQLGKH